MKNLYFKTVPGKIIKIFTILVFFVFYGYVELGQINTYMIILSGAFIINMCWTRWAEYASPLIYWPLTTMNYNKPGTKPNI